MIVVGRGLTFGQSYYKGYHFADESSLPRLSACEIFVPKKEHCCREYVTVINIPANTMRTFCWRQVIRLSLSLTRKVTWPYLCPFKIDRKANGAPFAFSEWLCSRFFAYISFKLLYCFFGINSTIKIVVVVVVGGGGCSFATYKLTQERT